MQSGTPIEGPSARRIRRFSVSVVDFQSVSQLAMQLASNLSKVLTNLQLSVVETQ